MDSHTQQELRQPKVIARFFDNFSLLQDLTPLAHSLITTVKTLLSSLELEPHRLFVYFCYRACMDYSLLVDFLLSNETDFLLFFLQYLRYVEKDPESLKKTCSSFEQENDGISLGNIANMLQRLVFVLKGGGFPYNPSSLVKRINSVLRSIQ